jgi:dihydroxyacetone kinase-like predicted kinase
MAEAAGQVRVGEVTQAVRDSGSPAGPIRAGDWLGLAADGVVAVAPDPVAAATAVLARLLGEEGSLLVVTGESAHPADTDAVRAWLQAQHPGVVVEVRDGGQPHYPFLFGAR